MCWRCFRSLTLKCSQSVYEPSIPGLKKEMRAHQEEKWPREMILSVNAPLCVDSHRGIPRALLDCMTN